MHDWKMLDPKGLELDETQARDVFINGQGMFTSNVGNVLPRANNPKLSKRAGDIAPTRFPGLADVGKGPMGWTRLYCIDAKTKVRDAAWRLIAYMGGKDKSGMYYTAKDWYAKYGVGYAFMSLDKDPDMIKVHRDAGWISRSGANSTPRLAPGRTSRPPGTTSGTATCSSRSRPRS
jgi:hypothetical protein